MIRRFLLACLGCCAFGAEAQTVFTVDSVLDVPDAVAGDGACQTATAQCTLRAALMEAGALPDTAGPVEIRVPPGTYALSHVVGHPQSSGDLDAEPPAASALLTIAGWENGAPAGAMSRPVITSAPGFKRRLLNVVANAGQTVQLRDLVLSGATPAAWDASGIVDNGAAVKCTSQQGGLLRLQRVLVSENASRSIGTIYSDGCRFEAVDASFDDNCGLTGALVSGQGTNSTLRKVSLDRVSFTRNDAACLGTAAQYHALTIAGDALAEPWEINVANATFGANEGSVAFTAPAGAASTARVAILRNVTIHDNAPDYLGHDGVLASGDLQLRAGHSTLGASSHAGAGARVLSMGFLRADVGVSLGATFAPHATDLSLDAASLSLAPLQSTGDYTLGFPPIASSPLIDAGASLPDSVNEAACTFADQAGTARPTGQACDVGALEFFSARVFSSGFE